LTPRTADVRRAATWALEQRDIVNVALRTTDVARRATAAMCASSRTIDFVIEKHRKNAASSPRGLLGTAVALRFNRMSRVERGEVERSVAQCVNALTSYRLVRAVVVSVIGGARNGFGRSER
jgi:hypothetical protein